MHITCGKVHCLLFVRSSQRYTLAPPQRMHAQAEIKQKKYRQFLHNYDS